MCHSHVCITGMSLAGVYNINYDNIYIYNVNDTTTNEDVVIGCNGARTRRCRATNHHAHGHEPGTL